MSVFLLKAKTGMIGLEFAKKQQKKEHMENYRKGGIRHYKTLGTGTALKGKPK